MPAITFADLTRRSQPFKRKRIVCRMSGSIEMVANIEKIYRKSGMLYFDVFSMRLYHGSVLVNSKMSDRWYCIEKGSNIKREGGLIIISSGMIGFDISAM